MRVMGLDISATHPAIAVLEAPQGAPVCLFEDEFHSKKKGLDRALEIGDWVHAEIERWKPDAVAIEGYGYENHHNLVTLVEVGTVVRLMVKLAGCQWMEASPNSIKKLVTGKGNAEKAKVMLELFKRWQLDPKTNNTGDAMGAGMVALAMKGEIALIQVQKEALVKLSWCN